MAPEDGSEPELSKAEEDALTRESTRTLPDWVVRFFKGVSGLYDNLPDPGRSGKSGGKVEEQMISSLNVSLCSIVSWKFTVILYYRLPVNSSYLPHPTYSLIRP